MRIVQISEAEAADAAVMANVARYLLGDPGVAATQVFQPPYKDKPQIPLQAAQSKAAQQLDILQKPTIDAADLPATGFPPDPPPAAPKPAVLSAGIDAAAIGFGGGAGVPAPPLASVPSTAAVGQLPIVAATSTAIADVPPAPALPPAPPVAAPTESAAPSSLAAGVTVDSSGLPWDERIHSGSRDVNKDGTWRKRRGIPETTTAPVERELRAMMAIPAAPLPAATELPPAFVPQPSAGDVPPMPTAVADDPATRFTRWLEELTPHMQPGGAMTPDMLTAVLRHQAQDDTIGLALYMQRPDLIPAARVLLQRLMAGESLS